jgi:hypothetical protein
MKKIIHLAVLLLFSNFLTAQITSPIQKARFGVDGELRANYLGGSMYFGTDDWFINYNVGGGRAVIDTTGAAAMMARYAVDPAFRRQPFYRTMSVPQYSIINEKLWIDAVNIRDYNGQTGTDETAFILSNKNGQSPANWTGGATPVLAKTDIFDMFVHVRRDGRNATDSLWFMGGMSLQGQEGQRYFDFELYQTDIFYSRATGRFSGYGPDEGHTSWELDASGNIIKPGDVIFTAEYQSQGLSRIEARIWVNKNTLSISPAEFNWSGAFDGALQSSQYGYASITPKTVGAYYTGTESGNNTWAGPFGFIDAGNVVRTNYGAKQFMEFSVNLSKLGLDPMTILGGNACGLPFRRILVKTRTSASFTSELTDFIGPFDFFSTPPVQAQADVPMYCGVMGVSNISILNPLPSSVYTWSTLDGRILYGQTTGSSITVDTTGTYVVSQQLLDGCNSTSSDTVMIVFDAHCTPLNTSLINFRGSMAHAKTKLSWTTTANMEVQFFDVERSVDGKNFFTVGRVQNGSPALSMASYAYSEDVAAVSARTLYYRLHIKEANGRSSYSNIIKLTKEEKSNEVMIYPNPAHQYVALSIPASRRSEAVISVVDPSGKAIYYKKHMLQQGANEIIIDETRQWPSGVYLVNISTENDRQWRKVVVAGTALK